MTEEGQTAGVEEDQEAVEAIRVCQVSKLFSIQSICHISKSKILVLANFYQIFFQKSTTFS